MQVRSVTLVEFNIGSGTTYTEPFVYSLNVLLPLLNDVVGICLTN